MTTIEITEITARPGWFRTELVAFGPQAVAATFAAATVQGTCDLPSDLNMQIAIAYPDSDQFRLSIIAELDSSNEVHAKTLAGHREQKAQLEARRS